MTIALISRFFGNPQNYYTSILTRTAFKYYNLRFTNGIKANIFAIIFGEHGNIT